MQEEEEFERKLRSDGARSVEKAVGGRKGAEDVMASGLCPRVLASHRERWAALGSLSSVCGPPTASP